MPGTVPVTSTVSKVNIRFIVILDYKTFLNTCDLDPGGTGMNEIVSRNSQSARRINIKSNTYKAG